MTLPVRPSTGCGGGCSPSETCPAPEPVTYEVTLSGGWNPAWVPGSGLPLPVLAINAPVGDLTPEPPLPLQMEQANSEPVSAPADAFPADDQWQVIVPLAPTDTVGLVIPLAFAPPFLIRVPGWQRFRFVDGNGCESFVYVFYPNGIPGDDSEDVVMHVFYGPDTEPIIVTVEAPEVSGEPGPTVEVALTVTPECPAPAAFVPVGPACGLDRIPVDAEVTFPDTPIQVVNPDSEGGPVPLAVEVVNAPDVPAVGFYQVDSSSGGGSGLRFEDVTWIEVRRTDDGTDPTDVKVWDQPSGSPYGVNLAGGETFEVPPIAGQTFGLNIAVSNDALVQVAYR